MDTGVKRTFPQGLKPASCAGLNGTAEAVPYRKPIAVPYPKRILEMVLNMMFPRSPSVEWSRCC